MAASSSYVFVLQTSTHAFVFMEMSATVTTSELSSSHCLVLTKSSPAPEDSVRHLAH